LFLFSVGFLLFGFGLSFFLIILFGGYGVMLTSMAKHREDIQLTPKQIWGSAGIAFVVMLLLRLVEYLVFKM
jgi:hypothetical protein